MNTRTYQIKIFTQLGPRCGTLSWTEQSGTLSCTLSFLGQRNLFTGRCSPGSCEFAGQVQTIVSCIPYHASCTLHGDELQGTFHTASGDFPITGTANTASG